MKSLHIKPVLLLFLVFFSSCSTTKEYILVTLEPASVELESNIKRIGIINESLVQQQKEYENRIEQILSEKDLQLDKEGKKAAIAGLFDELLKDKRFDTIKIIEGIPATHKSRKESSEEISWSKVETLCKEHNVDAIFSLSHYDTETQVSLRKKKILQANMLRVKEKVRGNEITLETLIENGWRIYNPKNKQVIDEMVFTEVLESKAEGITPVQALIAIEDRVKEVSKQSKNKGEAYGMRLLPSENGVVRKYFIKGGSELQLAHSYVEVADWESAVKVWESLQFNTDLKVKSRAIYNLAFYEEIKGNLGGALYLANKAQEIQSSKVYQYYVKALQERIEENEIVKEQLARTYFQEVF
ncbi:DUF6340 family protein [uncultured Maribacter sp.]|uniref:DUF6340 family protein n=1 Tax=uncultured Maribacter sp. TaxID=431308 RepID=UPI0026179264|nr:DUF6340 family protein [uncultured Maribacter sp.]